MTRILTILALIILTIGIGVISFYHPVWLSDQNKFLKGFMNHELLAVLGVIVTITLASAANLHLEFNRLEETFGEGFSEARSATKAYAYLLIILFVTALALVVLKPILASNDHLEAAFNGAGIVIIAVNILSLMDLTSAVFAIPPDRNLKNNTQRDEPSPPHPPIDRPEPHQRGSYEGQRHDP